MKDVGGKKERNKSFRILANFFKKEIFFHYSFCSLFDNWNNMDYGL